METATLSQITTPFKRKRKRIPIANVDESRKTRAILALLGKCNVKPIYKDYVNFWCSDRGCSMPIDSFTPKVEDKYDTHGFLKFFLEKGVSNQFINFLNTERNVKLS